MLTSENFQDFAKKEIPVQAAREHAQFPVGLSLGLKDELPEKQLLSGPHDIRFLYLIVS